MMDGSHIPMHQDCMPRFRALDPNLGRWTRQDPLGYVDGPNRYNAYGSKPIDVVDPLGLEIVKGSPTHPQASAAELEQIMGQWEQAKQRSWVSWFILRLIELHDTPVIIEISTANSDSTMLPIEPNNPDTDGNPHDPTNRPRMARINHNPTNRRPNSVAGNPPHDPEATLIHEATHILLDILGLQPRSRKAKEIIASIAENIHRDAMGLNPRLDYGDWQVPQLPWDRD